MKFFLSFFSYCLGKEFSFDVDVSQLPCGLNGALYFVEMPADGGKNKSKNSFFFFCFCFFTSFLKDTILTL